jgi:hypothetical protein
MTRPWTRRAALTGLAATAAVGAGAVWGRRARAEVEAARRLPLTAGGTVQGMTISCQTWGWEWGTDAMVSTMAELKGLGVNWIAIHPYARIRDDGTVQAEGLDDGAPDWLERPIREAHALGQQIMIKPHLAYWRSKWSWRGEIDFPDPAQRARFWATYPRWIERLAELSSTADAFVVGTELDRITGDEARWRSLITDVRSHTDAHLTFASNWDAYATLPFWDALDAIGVQAYFPVAAGEGPPDDATLRAGWQGVLGDLTALQQRIGKPVVFTELGYNESARAAHEPWAYDRGGPGAADVQSRCLRVALESIAATSTVSGAFLWKWFPGELQMGDFLMASPSTRAVIAQAWRPKG